MGKRIFYLEPHVYPVGTLICYSPRGWTNVVFGEIIGYTNHFYRVKRYRNGYTHFTICKSTNITIVQHIPLAHLPKNSK